MIVLSGGWQSDLIRAWSKGDHAAADTYLHFWSKLLPNRYYLEVHRIGVADEVSFIQQTLSFSTAFKLPVVATNPVCFMAKDDFEAHQARVCIHRGEVLAQASGTHTQSQYLVSSAKMTTLFADMPAALENSVAIAKRCACILPLDTLNMPRFSNESEADIAKRLVRDANLGLNKLIADLAPSYQQRLDFELKMIAKMGFASYFLIVADFIKWAKDNGIPVGPGRGSGVGSMVAYGLGITALDPIEHGLLFERFLNPERVSMPDFDIDFCMEKRDLVIDYVANKHGREHVAQIITFGTMAAKAVVRDVGRVLAMPYGMVDGIAKLIPFEIGITLEKAIAQEPRLPERIAAEPEVETLFKLARKLEGVTRNVGKHAGGVVIAPRPLSTFMPLYQYQSQAWIHALDLETARTINHVQSDLKQ